MDNFCITEDYDKVIITKNNTLRDIIHECIRFKRCSKDGMKLYLSDPRTVFRGGQGQGDDVYFISDKHQFQKYERHESFMQSIKITARDLSTYPPQVRETVDKELQYLEVGAGMGEPVVVMALKRGFPKPIIIDPVDYNLLGQMLIFARDELMDRLEEDKSRNIVKINTPRINTLIERCKIIQDPDRVVLYNMTLDQSRRHRNLQGIADVVVDFWGPKRNSDMYDDNQQKSIDRLELRLLKKTGRLIQYGFIGSNACVYDSEGLKIDSPA